MYDGLRFFHTIFMVCPRLSSALRTVVLPAEDGRPQRRGQTRTTLVNSFFPRFALQASGQLALWHCSRYSVGVMPYCLVKLR